MASINAILVSVQYADYLQLTLPYNRHHFDRVMVVTTPGDAATHAVAQAHNAEIFATDAFYEGGASFNKWAALELGLDALGRQGWLCILDADVRWPKDLKGWEPQKGYLHTPFRRMMDDMSRPIPAERLWRTSFPRHHVMNDFSGYTQIFHAEDPVLGAAPWHQTYWRHAGGADTFFQNKWPKTAKLRPSWECLHLGPAGQNWCGRSSTFLDGTVPEGAAERKEQLRQFMAARHGGLRTPGRFEHEWLDGTNRPDAPG